MALKIKSELTVIDRGWIFIQAQLKLADNSYTKIGVQQNTIRKAAKGKNSDMSNMLIVAAANEFGTKTIPERPFIRGTFDEQRIKLGVIIRREYDRILNGRSNVIRSLGLIGEFMEARTKQKIVSIKTPPNAPSTIRRKGSSNPLIDTGQLRQSIRHVEVING